MVLEKTDIHKFCSDHEWDTELCAKDCVKWTDPYVSVDRLVATLRELINEIKDEASCAESFSDKLGERFVEGYVESNRFTIQKIEEHFGVLFNSQSSKSLVGFCTIGKDDVGSAVEDGSLCSAKKEPHLTSVVEPSSKFENDKCVCGHVEGYHSSDGEGSECLRYDGTKNCACMKFERLER